MASEDDVVERDTAHVRHLHAGGDHVDLLHQMVDEVAILHAVGRDGRPLRKVALRHAEDVVVVDVVLRQAPADRSGRFHEVQDAVLDDEMVGRDLEDLVLATVEKVGAGMGELFEDDVVALFQPFQVGAEDPAGVVVQTLDAADLVPNESGGDGIELVRVQIVLLAEHDVGVEMDAAFQVEERRRSPFRPRAGT